MSRQEIHARIDTEVYLLLKNKNVNISNTVNKLLKSYLEFDKLPKKEEEEILSELSELNKEKDKLIDKISKLSVYLTHLRENNEKNSKEELDKLLRLSDAFRDSGVFTGGR